jgi:hypothetical protein
MQKQDLNSQQAGMEQLAAAREEGWDCNNTEPGCQPVAPFRDDCSLELDMPLAVDALEEETPGIAEVQLLSLLASAETPTMRLKKNRSPACSERGRRAGR